MASTCTYLVLKVHKIDYFFSLSYLEKLFVYSAMIKEKESEQQKLEVIIKSLASILGLKGE